MEAAASLDLVGGLLAGLNVSGDDPLPPREHRHFNPAGRPDFLLLTINHRYIVARGRDVDTAPTWWLIHPGPHAVTEVEEGEVLHFSPFAHQRHDAPDSAPRLVQYRAAFVLENLDELAARIRTLAARELAACRGAAPRRYHPLAYVLALDDAVRTEVLPSVAFGTFSRAP